MHFCRLRLRVADAMTTREEQAMGMHRDTPTSRVPTAILAHRNKYSELFRAL